MFGFDTGMTTSDLYPLRIRSQFEDHLLRTFVAWMVDGGSMGHGPYSLQTHWKHCFCALLKPSTRFTLEKPPSPADARFAVAGKVIIGVRPWGICSYHWIKPRRFDSKLPFGLSRTRLPIPRRSSLWPTPFPSATKTAFSSTLRRFLSFPFFILFYFAFSSPEYLPIGKILFFALRWSVCVERSYFMPRSCF